MSKKIFQIGFNKSGTISLYEFFKANNFKSIHWDKGELSKAIDYNIKNNYPPLLSYEDYEFFSDMEHMNEDYEYFYSSEEYFKTLDKYYPNSLFILNYRPFDDFAKSRVNHGLYLFNTMYKHQKDKSGVIQYWKERYEKHINNATEYFHGKDNFLLLKMDSNANNNLIQFLESHNIQIINKTLTRSHKTSRKSSQNELIDKLRDLALELESYDIEKSLIVMEAAKKIRPYGPTINNRINMYKKHLIRMKDEG